MVGMGKPSGLGEEVVMKLQRRDGAQDGSQV